jgi:4-hydroxy-tetrahydrodipicolinate reductase
MIRVLIHGGGKMGRRLLAALRDSAEFELAGLVSELRPEGLADADWRPSLADFNSTADLLIDFTLTGGPGVAAHWCEENRVPLLSGTTALSDQDQAALQSAAREVPVMWAPNLSFGVALMTGLVRRAAGALGTGASIHVTETHHVHKLDAPSGTALALAEAAGEGRHPAEDDEITFTSNREGEVVGEHTVCFSFGDEVLEITHKALDRDIFVRGSLKAGAWLLGQKPGYYSTRDWLALD